MKTKEVKVMLKNIIATLEDKRQRERNLSILYAHSDEEETPHVAAVKGRESGLSKAIEIVKGKLDEL